MDSLLQSLSLGFLLRCLASGILGVISFRVASGICGEPLIEFKAHQVGAALLLGAIIYGIHRSLFYPIIEWFLDSERAKSCRAIVPLISRQSCDALRTRWLRAGEKDQPNSGIVKHTTGWADWAHMQYSSSWCVSFGMIAGAVVTPAQKTNCLLIIFSGLFAAAALISDWRVHSVEEYLSSLDKRAEQVHDEALVIARGAGRIAKGAFVIALLALIVAAIQSFCRP
jgi:hypothetical protein